MEIKKIQEQFCWNGTTRGIHPSVACIAAMYWNKNRVYHIENKRISKSNQNLLVCSFNNEADIEHKFLVGRVMDFYQFISFRMLWLAACGPFY